MASSLIQRYVQRHKGLVRRNPEDVKAALSRFGDLYRKAERGLWIFFMISLLSALISLAQLFGITLTAELYGQRLSDIPERTFLAASVAGFSYLFALGYGVSSVVYEALTRWVARELYGDESDLLYRSHLSVEVLGSINNIIRDVDKRSDEKATYIGLKACFYVTIAVALVVLLVPIGIMYYFCSQVSPSRTSLADFEFWFVGTLATVDLLMLLVGATAAVTAGDLDT